MEKPTSVTIQRLYHWNTNTHCSIEVAENAPRKGRVPIVKSFSQQCGQLSKGLGSDQNRVRDSKLLHGQTLDTQSFVKGSTDNSELHCHAGRLFLGSKKMYAYEGTFSRSLSPESLVCSRCQPQQLKWQWVHKSIAPSMFALSSSSPSKLFGVSQVSRLQCQNRYVNSAT